MNDRKRLHELFGWALALLFLVFGLSMEVMHAFKVDAFLDTDQIVRREFFSLAHTHGLFLAFMNLLFSLYLGQSQSHLAARIGTASRLLLFASLLMPFGFLLAGLFPLNGDPGVGIFIVPVGSICLILSIGLLLYQRIRSNGGGTQNS